MHNEHQITHLCSRETRNGGQDDGRAQQREGPRWVHWESGYDNLALLDQFQTENEIDLTDSLAEGSPSDAFEGGGVPAARRRAAGYYHGSIHVAMWQKWSKLSKSSLIARWASYRFLVIQQYILGPWPLCE